MNWSHSSSDRRMRGLALAKLPAGYRCRECAMDSDWKSGMRPTRRTARRHRVETKVVKAASIRGLLPTSATTSCCPTPAPGQHVSPLRLRVRQAPGGRAWRSSLLWARAGAAVPVASLPARSQEAHAREIAARPIKARDKTLLDRVAAARKYDGGVRRWQPRRPAPTACRRR